MSHRVPRSVPIAALLAAGCATMTGAPPPAEEGWAREEYDSGASVCVNDCAARYDVAGRELVVERDVELVEISLVPGWDDPSVLDGILSVLTESMSGTTVERTYVGTGTMSVTSSDATDPELRCRVFWMEEREIERDDEYHDDLVSRTARLTEGMTCQTESAGTSWRFEQGVAPPLDSVAAVYDSLVADRAPEAHRRPAMQLRRLEPAPATTYSVTDDRASGGRSFLAIETLRIRREDGSTVAVVHNGVPGAIDFAPDASDDEKRALRLLGLALADRP